MYRFVVLAISLFNISGCQFGPSDFFRSLDADGNEKIDLQEWMDYYGPHDHSWQRCSGKDFEPADCDGDQALSWREYHSARFDHNFCGDGTPFVKLIYQKPVTNRSTGIYELVNPCELQMDASAQSQRDSVAIAPGPLLECPP